MSVPSRQIDTSPSDMPCLNIVISRYVAEDAGAWDDYVQHHSDSTVFHLSCWGRIVEQIHGHKNLGLIARSEGKVVGVLPLALNKTLLFGCGLVSLPFCPYAGPIAENLEVQSSLLGEAQRLSEQFGAAHFECRSLSLTSADAPTQSLYFTFRKKLSTIHEENLNAIPRKQRAMVRKGIKNELTARPGSVEEFYQLYSDNIHRHGTPGSPKAFFQKICDELGENAEISVIQSKEGLLLTGVLTLYFKREALPFYAGDVLQARDLAANDFKYWAVMQRAVERGADVFDFGRSKKDTGPYHFKKNWGFEPHQLYYQYFGLKSDSLPENNPLNPKFQLMIAVWRKLPRFFVNWLGPKVVKGLG